MRTRRRPRQSGLCLLAAVLLPLVARGQPEEDMLGAWYMYLWTATVEGSPFGFQGDIQHRNWNRRGDLEQGLIRAGATWVPAGWRTKLTLGYAHVTSGVFGHSDQKNRERRVYQEALLTPRIGRRTHLIHRVRLEQRRVEGQDRRNRVRYYFGLNFPFNQDDLTGGAWYLSFYNEIFINLERDIGSGRRVDGFDRNRAYVAFGHSLRDQVRLQAGYMYQQAPDFGKGQLQLSVVQSF